MAYPNVYGRPFRDDLDADPAATADFDALIGPGGHGAPDPEVLPSGDPAGGGDVLMMVLVGGRERSLDDFARQLALGAGSGWPTCRNPPRTDR